MIIDTETHVLRFARSSINNPTGKLYRMNRHFTWHEHPGELLATEMDVAGVDKAFLISYDAEDCWLDAELEGYTLEDFSGGRKYTLVQVRKFPDRFLWFNTLKNLRRYDAVDLVRRDAALGMVGVKIFPAHLEVSLLEDEMLRVFDTCRDLDLRVLISFEPLELHPTRSRPLTEYLSEMDELAGTYPGVKFALLHTGCVDPLTQAAEAVFSITRKHSNLYLSTANPGKAWDDGTEYPFRNYLARMRITCEEVGPTRVMWATDWPWYDWAFKYEQGVNAIRKHAEFLSERDKRFILGETAAEFMGSRLHDQVQPEG